MNKYTVIGLRVERAGPLALLQDAGRFGVRRLGVTQGGPADLHGWAWANRLAGNAWGTPALEVTFGGLALVAERDLTIAVAGADLAATLDGEPLALWQSVPIKEGQTLAFGTPRNGLRAYLAVAGGFRAEPVLGSVSCVVREGLGGFDGHGAKLTAGDRLAVTPGAGERVGREAAPVLEQPDYTGPASLALLPGAQVADFTGASLYAAFNRPWRVDDRADRMGVRLTGPRLSCRIGSLISEGIGLGAVQVPPDGQPIALLNDRQTIGGYPRLGALTPLAASRLAQCLPGQEVRLVATTGERALGDYRRFRRLFEV
ncbi:MULTISPECIES: biotin-dependent carboxyltransferase family protein [unclassified Halomonas]|uniref:5-oxoprolinase subunit C family protein n=1 Tax=unclassified Halomonas TaxID=2609666 RepID=UPI002886FE7E|nr:MULTISPECIES: biotin-dependent carboxyltransferase family protein [unclassified Halomonas]MDT0500430.1 biotin-dependent carboxyltransferase family protein [Halomonas sp. PAR7]MDT0511673.1 biotin-dependent carboxyltransferase family protein [Halomonas sp. LES1]MDT0590039.1 biotin-dependent carboxyltransferase family protein [Halomonas sp. PAR8]